MTPKDRALFQASIDFCMGHDPQKTWRRDDFIDYVSQTSGVDNLITWDHDGASEVPRRH